MGNFNNVTMGNGILRINGVDVGYLKGDVSFKYNYDVEEFKTGVPRSLRGSVTKEIFAELTAPLAEITSANIAQVLGGLTPAVTAGSEVDKTGTWETLTFSKAPWTGNGGIEAIKLGPTNNRPLWVEISDGVDAPQIGTNVTSPVLYAENTDYVVDYKTGYVYRVGSGIASGETVKCKYKYTPPASSQIQLGYSFSLSEVTVEFEHTK